MGDRDDDGWTTTSDRFRDFQSVPLQLLLLHYSPSASQCASTCTRSRTHAPRAVGIRTSISDKKTNALLHFSRFPQFSYNVIICMYVPTYYLRAIFSKLTNHETTRDNNNNNNFVPVPFCQLSLCKRYSCFNASSCE